jgi:hypothetical protein
VTGQRWTPPPGRRRANHESRVEAPSLELSKGQRRSKSLESLGGVRRRAASALIIDTSAVYAGALLVVLATACMLGVAQP